MHRTGPDQAERGAAGAEVVKRDADAEVAQGVEGVERLAAGEDGRLGHFEDQVVRVEPGVVDGVGDLVGEAGILELAAGHVDPDGRR